MIRTEDKALKGEVKTGGTGLYGSVLPTKTTTTAYAYKGTKRYIDSVDEGSFIPGVMRLNPCVIRRESGTSGRSYLRSKTDYTSGPYYGLSYFAEGDIAGLSISPQHGTWDIALELETAAAAYAKLQETQWDTGVFLAELLETLDMLKNPLKGLAKFGRKARRAGSLPEYGKHVVGFAADSWLTYIYGIKPFLNDINAIIALCDGLLVKHYHTLLRKRATRKSSTSTTTVTTGGTGYFGYPIVRTRRVTTKCTTVVYYKNKQEGKIQGFARNFGLNIGNIPSIAWERVPYSFLVDWVLNVGDWLKAIAPTGHIEFCGSCTSQKTVVLENVSMGEAYPTGLYSAQLRMDMNSRLPATWQGEQLIRKVGTTVPVVPVWKSRSLSLSNKVTALSLIWQQVAKEHRR
jgi:hypothetical protein